jgi:hypothetical protein
MVRLLANMDVAARYVLPEPATANLVKQGQVDIPRSGSDGLPVTAIESVVTLPWRRSPQTSNLDRRLRDLESAVVNGFITAAEADRAFPRKTRVGGRPRAKGNEDFASWLRARIRQLSDRDGLIDEVRRLQIDHTIPRARRAARVRKLNRRVGACDPAYVDKLRAALAALEVVPAIDVEAVLRRQSERAAILRQKLRPYL